MGTVAVVHNAVNTVAIVQAVNMVTDRLHLVEAAVVVNTTVAVEVPKAAVVADVCMVMQNMDTS